MILSNYAIKFRTAVFVFIAVFALAGGISYVSLPREGSPDITIPYVFVTAIYEGRAPVDMEKLVAIPLEKQLNDVDNVKEMSSMSADSVVTITLEFEAGQDIDTALQKTKNKVDLAAPDLPDDLDEPVVQAINISSDVPILRFALSGETPLQRLKGLAESIQDRVEQVDGVKAVEISGTREREIRVEVDMVRLATLRIPIGLVMQRIAQENRTISAGNIDVSGDKFQVRVPGEFGRAVELESIRIADHGGQSIFLRDVADVHDTFKDIDTLSRVNGTPCVAVGVKKRAGENSVRMIHRVQEVLDAFALPSAVGLTVIFDESHYIDMMIAELENNITSGFLLVVVVLLIFMGARNSFFVALAIPFSMLIAFTVMALLGFSMNMIVLFSLVLAVGMLVDNAIVIVENIYRHRTEGATRAEAARLGAAEVAWPVITSTLTTCAAFSPLMFWPGIMGQFMGFLPKTLIVVLFASLFVALIINPAVCSALISRGKKVQADDGKTDASVSDHGFMAWYEGLLRGALGVRAPVFLLGIVCLIATVLAYARFGEGVELFPEIDPRNASVQVAYAQGTSIERTDQALRKVETILAEYEDIKFYQTNVGIGGGGGFLGGGEGTHLGSIFIEFVDMPERDRSSMVQVEEIRERVGQIPGATVVVDKQEEGPPQTAPLTIEITGEEFDVLSDIAAEIMRRCRTVPGLVDLQDDFEEAVPELQFNVDRDRAALFDLDTSGIGHYLRTAVYGIESSTLRIDEDEYDITVRFPKHYRDGVNMLDPISIPRPHGGSVPLTSLGMVSYAGGQGAIKRIDQKRVVTVTGNNANRGIDKILKDVQARLAAYELPRGYSLRYRGEDEEMKESGAFLAKAFGVALGLILVILVLQFNSAVLPLIIVFSVVLSLVGVMWGLLICGMRFGVIMTGVGVISLAGIVVNNAIVLVDCIQQRIEDGLPVTEAIVTAGRLRLRPVLLTAVTTILGLIPMAIGYSLDVHSWPPKILAGTESSAWWAPMAVAVIFGLGVATVLTLVLVPVMFSLAHSASRVIRRHLSIADD